MATVAVDHVLSRDEIIWGFGPDLEPVLEVEPGAIVRFETNDCPRRSAADLYYQGRQRRARSGRSGRRVFSTIARGISSVSQPASASSPTAPAAAAIPTVRIPG